MCNSYGRHIVWSFPPKRPSYFSYTQFSLESPDNPKEAITLDLVSCGQTLAAPNPNPSAVANPGSSLPTMSNLRSPSPYSDEEPLERTGVSPDHGNDELEILDDILTIRPRGSKDEVRTLRVGTGKAAAGKEYQDTNAYLGFHEDKTIEVYAKKAGGRKWIVYGAEPGSLDERLELESKHKPLRMSAVVALIRERTVEGASVGGGCVVHRACGESPETIGSSSGLEAGGGVEYKVRGDGPRTGGTGARDAEVNARGRGGMARVLNGPDIAFFPQVFHMRLLDVAAPLVLIGVGMVLAYFSVFFAFVLLRLFY